MNIISEVNHYFKIFRSRIESSAISKRMADNSIWSFSGSLISQGSSLIVTIISARLLGKTGFGELGLINSTILLLCLAVNFGFALTSLKFVAEYFKKDKSKTGEFIGFIYVISIISSSIFLLFYFLIVYKVPVVISDAPNLSKQFQMAGIIIVLYSFINTQTSILMGYEKFTYITKVNIFRGVVLIFFSAICIYYWDLTGAIIGLIIESLVTILLNHWYIKLIANDNSISFRWRLTKEFKPMMLRFSFPAYLASLVVPFTIWAGNSLLTNSPDGFRELGEFTAAYQWRNLVMFIPITFGNATLPIITSEIANNEILSAKKVVKITMLLSGLSAVLIGIILILGKDFLMSLFGNGFGSDPNTFVLLILSSIIAAVLSPIGNLIIASNKMWTGFWMNFGWSVSSIIFSAILIFNNQGSLGLAAGFLIGYILHGSWTLAIYFRIK